MRFSSQNLDLPHEAIPNKRYQTLECYTTALKLTA